MGEILYYVLDDFIAFASQNGRKASFWENVVYVVGGGGACSLLHVCLYLMVDLFFFPHVNFLIIRFPQNFI